MTVYFIRAGETEAVKIGKADDVAGRIRELQIGNHTVLSLIRQMEGSFREERWLHNHFRAQHIGREWFRFTPDMLTVAVPIADALAPVHRGIIKRWPSDEALAGDLGVKLARVRKWHQRRIPSDFWSPIVAAAAARGLPVALDDFVKREAA